MQFVYRQAVLQLFTDHCVSDAAGQGNPGSAEGWSCPLLRDRDRRGHATALSGSLGEEPPQFENHLYFHSISLLQQTCAKQCLLPGRPTLGVTQPEGFSQDKLLPIPPLPLLPVPRDPSGWAASPCTLLSFGGPSSWLRAMMRLWVLCTGRCEVWSALCFSSALQGLELLPSIVYPQFRCWAPQQRMLIHACARISLTSVMQLMLVTSLLCSGPVWPFEVRSLCSGCPPHHCLHLLAVDALLRLVPAVPME